MTSNVVALPGVGIGAHAHVRPAIGAEDRETNGQRAVAAEEKPLPKAANSNARAVRPNSPVALNSLLAAQEQGGETAVNKEAQAPAKGTNGETSHLTEEEQNEVEQLKKIDAEVRRHEQAHATAGGKYAGAPQYGYTEGPDGNRYATSGHVSIDVTPIPNDPKATMQKMDVVRRAALAPAEPSGADRSVAAKASAEKQKAQIELAQLKAEELAGGGGQDGSEPAGEVKGDPTAPAGDKSHGTGSSGDKQAAAPAVSHAAAAAAYAAPLNAIAGT